MLEYKCMHFFSRCKCIFKYKRMHVNAREYSTFPLYHMAARRERREVAGNAPALRCMIARSRRWEHAARSPRARATGCDYVIFAA